MSKSKKKHRNKYSNSYVYHIKQLFFSAICDKRQCASIAADLKSKVDTDTLTLSLAELFKVSPHYKGILWGNIFPESIKELGEGNSYFYKSKSLFDEVNWLYIQIVKNLDRIQFYVDKRDSIEKDILLGYYDSAIEKLESVKDKCGLSVWYYEMKILIYSYLQNEKKAIELISQVNREKEKSNCGFVTFLLSFLYKRCTKSYSAFAFDTEIENHFKTNHAKSHKDRNVYYLMRLDFYKSYQQDDLSPALIMEATNSLIDRYNILMFVLRAFFVNSDNVLEKVLLSGFTKKLYAKVNDGQLLPLVAYDNAEKLPVSYYNECLIDILDAYYQGEYNDVILRCRQFLVDYYPYFDVLVIYSRSLIAQGKKYVNITANPDSILNQITLNLFYAMSEPDNEEHLHNLYQINKNLYSLSIACGLDYYISSQQNENHSKSLRCLSLFYFDPLYCNILEDEDSKFSYLDSSCKYISDSIVIEYQRLRIKNNIGKANRVSTLILDTDKAKVAFDNGDYEKSLDLWMSIFNNNASALPIIQCANSYIYRCYEKMDKRQDAISFYVNQYLKGKTYVSRIDTTPLINQLYKDKYKKGVKNGLDLQLYVFINAKEEERKSCVLERYCNYKDVERVSELIPLLKDENKREKVEFYFFLLASEDILRHVLYITSTKMMLDEQQKIAQYLSSLSSSVNFKLYNRLNQEILDEMIVYQNIVKIDESKIYVNQNALIKYELKEYEGLYNQFKKQLLESASTNSYIVVNTISPWNIDQQSSSIIHQSVKFTNKAFIDAACQLFSVVRDKFLYSKFGLKTYLSTRIRHGVLEGVLRSGFDGLHILLSTQNNKYLPINYWRNKYGLRDNEQAELMKMLENFSKDINNEIDRFKEDALQIRIMEEEKGMFDYILTPDDMCFATVSSETQAKNFEEFCGLLMEYLLRMTNKCLLDVRKRFSESINNGFGRIIDNLSQDIFRFRNSPIHTELTKVINDARVDVNKKMAQVEKWFYLQEAKFEDFSLAQQMRAVWTITKRMYPNINCELKFDGEEYDVKIRAAFFIHFSDILTIFYNNMLRYSVKTRIRHFVMSIIRENDDSINLHFENDVELGTEAELNEKFKDMLKSYSRLQNEGKSGLVKVKKIIKFDLGCENNELKIKAEEGKCIVDINIDLREVRV